jgi:isocitrate/isopropylmalate dehydrogenase
MDVLEGDAAVTNTLAKGTAPPDLGGSVGTTGLTDEVIRCVVHMLDLGEPLA